MSDADELADELAAVLGPSQVLTDPDTRLAYEVDWTRRFSGSARAVVRPSSTDEVVSVIRLCAARSVPVVVQGGNTGLVGGGVPASGGPSPVILSTLRLDSVGPVDGVAQQVTAGAGVTLARLQDAARNAGLQFPVDLAARDTATVGGMVATNAGGLHVLRFGGMRAQVVGLEAVLADGTLISRLAGLVKDNTGYDLSQMLVGSEGTLGVITAARLRLVPNHAESAVALIGVESTAQAVALVATVRRRVESLQAAEIFFQDGLDLVCAHAGLGPPLPRRWPAYLLLECAAAEDQSDLLFEALAGEELPDDATAVAVDPTGRSRLWSYRERHTEAVSAAGVPHKLDVTLPMGRLAEFEKEVRSSVDAACPGSTVVLFGHVGDGNLHVNVVGPPSDDDTVDGAVLTLVAEMGGSISAEHGIGRAKTPWLHLSRTEAEIAVMRTVKSALDPDGLLNPGVLLGDGHA